MTRFGPKIGPRSGRSTGGKAPHQIKMDPCRVFTAPMGPQRQIDMVNMGGNDMASHWHHLPSAAIPTSDSGWNGTRGA